jgi:glycosyltransferase involved in cell wall biosynthesis
MHYPRSLFEVILVDDGSKSSITGIVSPFRDRMDFTLLRQPGLGPGAARNAGAVKARGRFLAFLDDDCAPSVNWLKTLSESFTATSNPVVGGRTINALHKNAYSTTSQLLIGYLYGYYNRNPEEALFLTSNNMCVAADIFRSVGGFDPGFSRAAAEDRELCARILSFGHRMTYAADAIVYHSHALALRTFVRQHFNYGRGAARFHWTRARQSQWRVKLEPLPFYIRLLRYPFSENSSHPASLIAGLLALSQAANAFGYIWERARFRENKHKC